MSKFKIDKGTFIVDQPYEGQRISDEFTKKERLDYYNQTQTENQAIIMKMEGYLQDFNNEHSIKHIQDLLIKYVIRDDVLNIMNFYFDKNFEVGITKDTVIKEHD